MVGSIIIRSYILEGYFLLLWVVGWLVIVFVVGASLLVRYLFSGWLVGFGWLVVGWLVVGWLFKLFVKGGSYVIQLYGSHRKAIIASYPELELDLSKFGIYYK